MSADEAEINSYMVLGTRFDVDSQYTVLDAVGQGAYGVVCAARSETTGQMIAIKKINSVFEHSTFAKRTLREVKLLRLLQHENIIGISALLRPLDPLFEDVYVVSELMETDLASIIKSPQPLSEEHCQFFLYQLLRGLKFIHSSCVMHRDLKPRNLLVNSNCDLKICDFGLARVDFPDSKWKSVAMTDYVATRWYRAPEIILSWRRYSKAIDMWSVGCILGELLQRRPLFAGENTNHQLMLIIEALGTPDEAVMANVRAPEVREFLQELPPMAPRPFEELFPEASPEARDLLERLLVMDPGQRYTVDEALEHPFLASLHCPEDEPAGEPLPRGEFDFERTASATEELRRELLAEIAVYHPDLRPAVVASSSATSAGASAAGSPEPMPPDSGDLMSMSGSDADALSTMGSDLGGALPRKD